MIIYITIYIYLQQPQRPLPVVSREADARLDGQDATVGPVDLCGFGVCFVCELVWNICIRICVYIHIDAHTLILKKRYTHNTTHDALDPLLPHTVQIGRHLLPPPHGHEGLHHRRIHLCIYE